MCEKVSVGTLRTLRFNKYLVINGLNSIIITKYPTIKNRCRCECQTLKPLKSCQVFDSTEYRDSENCGQNLAHKLKLLQILENNHFGLYWNPILLIGHLNWLTRNPNLFYWIAKPENWIIIIIKLAILICGNFDVNYIENMSKYRDLQ